MTTYAHLDGKAADPVRAVREVVALPDDVVPGKDIFTEAFAADLIPCGANVGQGWTTADGGKTFAAPAPVPVDLHAYAAAARYARETAGITVGTAPVATDRDSQALITGMWAAAQLDPQIQVAFKSGSGFVTIGADKVIKIAAAVAAHVQACFTAEAQVAADIASGKVKTTADVDAAFSAVTA